MNLTSPSQVKSWCIEHGFHPNKVLGQNFLVDRNALEAIVDAAALPAGTNVLEIGPGLGVLTEEMLRRSLVVTAIEKDPVLAERLAAALGNPPNLTVRAGDALDLIKDGSCDGFPSAPATRSTSSRTVPATASPPSSRTSPTRPARASSLNSPSVRQARRKRSSSSSRLKSRSASRPVPARRRAASQAFGYNSTTTYSSCAPSRHPASGRDPKSVPPWCASRDTTATTRSPPTGARASARSRNRHSNTVASNSARFSRVRCGQPPEPNSYQTMIGLRW